MSRPESGFFRGLRQDKARGICESVGGSLNGGQTVDIYESCVNCQVGECMMFRVVVDEESGKIVGREFTSHDSEY